MTLFITYGIQEWNQIPSLTIIRPCFPALVSRTEVQTRFKEEVIDLILMKAEVCKIHLCKDCFGMSEDAKMKEAVIPGSLV